MLTCFGTHVLSGNRAAGVATVECGRNADFDERRDTRGARRTSILPLSGDATRVRSPLGAISSYFDVTRVCDPRLAKLCHRAFECEKPSASNR